MSPALELGEWLVDHAGVLHFVEGVFVAELGVGVVYAVAVVLLADLGIVLWSGAVKCHVFAASVAEDLGHGGGTIGEDLILGGHSLVVAIKSSGTTRASVLHITETARGHLFDTKRESDLIHPTFHEGFGEQKGVGASSTGIGHVVNRDAVHAHVVEHTLALGTCQSNFS